MNFWQDNGTKILGGITAGLGTLQTFITTGAFNELLSKPAIGWMGIVLGFLTAVLGGATMARGFNNSAQVKVAERFSEALNTSPPKQGGFARVGMLAAIAAALLAGCAVLGVPKLQSFGERLAGGYVTVTGARTLTTTLLNGQVIGSKDAQNVQDQANSAREGLDVASTLTGIDAENKLNSALTIANAALDYLCAKAPTDPNCLGR